MGKAKEKLGFLGTPKHYPSSPTKAISPSLLYIVG
jgi:hypothetical protein